MFHVCKDVLCKDESGVHQTYEILASGTVLEILMAAFTFRRFTDYRHNSSGYREIPDLNFLDTVLSAHLTEAVHLTLLLCIRAERNTEHLYKAHSTLLNRT